MEPRSTLVLLFVSVHYLYFLIEHTSAASSCDNVPHELYTSWNPHPNDWRLESTECTERFKYLQVGDADPEDPEDRLDASLGFPVAGFSFQPSSLRLNCDTATIVARGLRDYTLDVIVRDGCPSHSLHFQMNVEFTDIQPTSNQHDPRLKLATYPATTFEVDRDLFDTDGETDVATLFCSDDDNDEITSVTITNQVSPFSVVATSFPTTFTLRLTGSLTFVASPMTLTLEVVDDGTPQRTGTTVLKVNIIDDAPATITTTPTTPTGTPSSKLDNSTEKSMRFDEQGGKGDTKTMVGWAVGVVLAVMFVLIIVLVYARKRNKLCSTSERTETGGTLFSTHESARSSHREATLDIYYSTPLENVYHSIGHVGSTCSSGMDRTSDYTRAGIAHSDTDTQDLRNDTVGPSSHRVENVYHIIGHVGSTCSSGMDRASDYTRAGIAHSDTDTQDLRNDTVGLSSHREYMVLDQRYLPQGIYDNNRHSRPSRYRMDRIYTDRKK